MRLSLVFSGFEPIAPSLPAVLAAEAAGLDGVWSCEHLGFHDAVVPAATYLHHTQRLEIGLVGLGTAGRHPALTATEIASLCELGAGRVRIQVGTGDATLTAKLGFRAARPLDTVESFVRILRELFAGRELDLALPIGTFAGFRHAPVEVPPAIDVMAIRPRMLRLATRVADGVSLSAGASREYLRGAVREIEAGLAEAGRDRSSFRITAMAFGLIMPGVDAALEMFGPMLATFPPETTAVLGAGAFDTGAFLAAAKAGRTLDAARLVTADAVRQISLAAEPEHVGAALEEYANTGIDELGVMLMGPPEFLPDAVKILAGSRPRAAS